MSQKRKRHQEVISLLEDSQGLAAIDDQETRSDEALARRLQQEAEDEAYALTVSHTLQDAARNDGLDDGDDDIHDVLRRLDSEERAQGFGMHGKSGANSSSSSSSWRGGNSFTGRGKSSHGSSSSSSSSSSSGGGSIFTGGAHRLGSTGDDSEYIPPARRPAKSAGPGRSRGGGGRGSHGRLHAQPHLDPLADLLGGLPHDVAMAIYLQSVGAGIAGMNPLATGLGLGGGGGGRGGGGGGGMHSHLPTDSRLRSLMSRELTAEDYDLLLELPDKKKSNEGACDADLSMLPTYTYATRGGRSVIDLLSPSDEVGAANPAPSSSSSASSSAATPGHADDDKCVVCMEPLRAGETVMRLPCQHVFHRDCIRSWLKLKRSCPIDNVDVF